MTIVWWWLVTIGVGLALTELLTGTFVLLWFGIGAIVAGLVTFATPELHVGAQVLLAAVLGGGLMVWLRPKYVSMDNAKKEDLYTFTAGPGVLKVSEDGKTIGVSARGTYWGIANPEVIPEGERLDGRPVTIERFENNRAVIACSKKDS